MKTDSFILRFRKKESPTGICNETVEALMNLTSLNKTEVVHLALRQMADRYLPKYEQDDGSLTDEQIVAIKATSSATAIPPENFVEKLL